MSEKNKINQLEDLALVLDEAWAWGCQFKKQKTLKEL